MSATVQVEAMGPGVGRRRWRYEALEWLRSRSTRTGGRTCMFALGAGVTVGSDGERSHVGGVGRCGSPWACPVCAPVIGERRATEIDAAVAAWTAGGGRVFFVTATLRHAWGDELGQLLEMLQGAWSRTFRWGGGDRPDWYGGQVRAVEVTYGGNGWHPHVHAAIFVEAGWDDCMADIERDLWNMRHDWADSVHLFGGSTLVDHKRSPGWDVREVNVRDKWEGSSFGSYLAKVEGGWGVGLELARLDLKRGNRGGVTPVALLSAAVEGDRRAALLFRIYEAATVGRRRIVASPGLMERCKVEVLDDEQAAEGEVVDDLRVVVSVPAGTWRKLLRAGFVARLLEDVAAFGRGEGWAWDPGWIVKPFVSS